MVLERFLFRLSTSKLNHQFVLKGGILFYVWTEKKFRPTKDLDFCYFGDFNKNTLLADIQKICHTQIPEDGLIFNNFKMSDIKEDHEYEGIRITFDGWLKKTRIPMQLDISTGDVITPEALEIKFPRLLGMEAPTLRAYPKETVFAEKAEALVNLDTASSRMKDIYDLFILIITYTDSLDKDILTSAVKATFNHRETEIPLPPAKVFSGHFFNNPDKQKQWQAFIKKSSEPNLELKMVLNTIADFINPIFSEAQK